MALTPNSRNEYHKVRDDFFANDHHVTGDPIEVSRRFSMLTRMAFSGLLANEWSRAKQTEGFSGWIGIIPAVHIFSRLLSRNELVCHNEDWVKVCLKYDGPNTMHYLDPPYVHETRVAKDAYLHEMSTKQHVKFCNACLGLKGMVIISGYDNPLYNKKLKGWERIDIPITTTVSKTVLGQDKPQRVESLWLNPLLMKRLNRTFKGKKLFDVVDVPKKKEKAQLQERRKKRRRIC